MSDEPEFLYLIAQVAIATVTLSGITMMLAVSGRSIEEARRRQILIQLRLAFLVTTLSIFPLILLLFDLDEQLLWRVASSTYLLVFILSVIFGFKHKLFPTGRRMLRLPSYLKRISAIILLPANLWLAEAWPYILQLFIAWNASMVLFLIFVGEIFAIDAREHGTQAENA